MSATRPRVLNFITSNRNKLAEATAILRGCVELRSQSVDVLEIQGTPRDIAADKCRRAAIAVRFLFFFFSGTAEVGVGGPADSSTLTGQWPSAR